MTEPLTPPPAAPAAKSHLADRRVPCICPAQADGAMARCLGISRARGIVTERVGCERCPRTWSRVNAR